MQLDLYSEYPLTAEAKERFRRDGFVRLKHVFSAEELAHYAPEIERLTLAKQARPLEERNTYGKDPQRHKG